MHNLSHLSAVKISGDALSATESISSLDWDIISIPSTHDTTTTTTTTIHTTTTTTTTTTKEKDNSIGKQFRHGTHGENEEDPSALEDLDEFMASVLQDFDFEKADILDVL